MPSSFLLSVHVNASSSSDSSLQPVSDSSLQPVNDSSLQPVNDSFLQPVSDSSLQPSVELSLQPVSEAPSTAFRLERRASLQQFSFPSNSTHPKHFWIGRRSAVNPPPSPSEVCFRILAHRNATLLANATTFPMTKMVTISVIPGINPISHLFSDDDAFLWYPTYSEALRGAAEDVVVSFPLEGVVECRVNSSDSVVREESVVGVERLPGFSIDFGIVLNGSLWSQPPQRRLQETDTLEDVLKLVPLLPFQSSLESALFRVFSFLPQFGHPHDEGNRRLRRLRSLCTPLERHVQKLPDFQQSSIDSFVRKYRT